MNLRRRSKLLIEPPAVATGDIAFNLIVFFLVCVSVSPDTGRKQDIPRAEPKKDQKDQTKPVEVSMGRGAVLINGNAVTIDDFEKRLKEVLKAKDTTQDDIRQMSDANRIVVVSTKDDKNTPYKQWILVTETIERIGGIVTLQLEEERKVEID